jgi:hypothetical protein
VSQHLLSLVRRGSRSLTSVTLVGIAGLHVAWGFGSSVPFRNRVELADSVIGADLVPSPTACLAVAAALLVASGLVADVPVGPRNLRRVGRRIVAGVLGVRGIAGVLGRTDLLSPGSTSPRFRQLDRRFYSPLCLLLALGSATAAD